ncbi:MAG: hypothetical protein FWG26_03035 [Betaproteobacteria bacterium]|nr:hypothetical protein [Betaproteobacteria bacterium]
MWQVDRKVYTLFIAIGAQSVDFGLLSRRGDSSHWSKQSCHVFNLPTNADETVLLMSLAKLEQRLSACHAHCRVRDVRVLIADIWLAQASLPWSAAMKRNESARENAYNIIALAGFRGNWAKPVQIDDMPYGTPRLAVAYPQAVLTALKKLATSLGARLGSVLPFSVAAWETALSKNQHLLKALALVDHGWLALLVALEAGTHLSEIVACRRSEREKFPLQAMQANWRRACLRQPQWADERVGVLSLAKAEPDDVKPDSSFDILQLQHETSSTNVTPGLLLAKQAQSVCHALDAVSRHPLPSRVQYVALTCGALLVVALSVLLFLTAQSIGESAARLEEVRPPAKQAASEPAWSREELSRVRAVNTAIQDLNLPIGVILRALQPPPEIRVAVLEVDATPGESAHTVKVTAEAPTGEDMAQYIGFISGHRPLTGAYLTRHEIIETASGRTYRFTTDVQWAD